MFYCGVAQKTWWGLLNLNPSEDTAEHHSLLHSSREDHLPFYTLIPSNLPEVMRYFEERGMKRLPQWAWCNSMHEFRLPPSRMWYVFGCESEASDSTPDKSSCAAASECITKPTAGAKSIFIWVQLMSFQLLTKMPPLRPDVTFFSCSSSFCAHARLCNFECDRVRVNVCVYEQ